MEYSGYKGDGASDAVISLEKAEMDKIGGMISSENEASGRLIEAALQSSELAAAVKEARNARDQFCLHLEKKYGIAPGTQWTLDFERGGIRVLPVAPIASERRSASQGEKVVPIDVKPDVESADVEAAEKKVEDEHAEVIYAPIETKTDDPPAYVKTKTDIAPKPKKTKE